MGYRDQYDCLQKEQASLTSKVVAKKGKQGVSVDQGQNALLLLQQRYGNRHVQRMLSVQRKSSETSDVDTSIEQGIAQKRGGGQSLDKGVQAQMGSAMGANFEGVRVHTDNDADNLNRHLNAKAFTTGNDIFFRQGEYNPGSSSGRELIAHELTHVVQQTGGLQRKMTLGQVGDKYEQEADQTARAVIRQENCVGDSCIKRQEEEEEAPVQTKVDNLVTQRQAVPEEEEEEDAVQAKRDTSVVQRLEEEEGEEEAPPLQAKFNDNFLMRQEEEEHEEQAAIQTRRDSNVLQRQPEEEEEELQTKPYLSPIQKKPYSMSSLAKKKL